MVESINRLFRRMKFQYKRASVLTDWTTFLMFDISMPVLQMMCFSLIGYYVYGADQVGQWMIGNAILISSFSALYNIGFGLAGEKYNGTLSLLVASRTSLIEVFLTNAISTISLCFISITVGVTIMSVLLHISWTLVQLISFYLILLVAIFVAMSFGFLFACLMLISTETHLIVNTAEKILLIFTGANFQISHLPHVVQYFSYSLPLTRSIEVAQYLMQGIPISYHYDLIVHECLLGVTFLIIGAIILTVMEKIAIRKGTLDML